MASPVHENPPDTAESEHTEPQHLAEPAEPAEPTRASARSPFDELDADETRSSHEGEEAALELQGRLICDVFRLRTSRKRTRNWLSQDISWHRAGYPEYGTDGADSTRLSSPAVSAQD